MNLKELFPELVKVKIQGKEYKLKFGTRSLIQLEKDYPDKVVNDKEITSQQQVGKAFLAAFNDGMKATDLINFLYAGLLHTQAVKSKEVLVDAIEPSDFSSYADAIVVAYSQAKATPEQLEKLQVMSESNGSKKNMGPGTTQESGPSTE